MFLAAVVLLFAQFHPAIPNGPPESPNPSYPFKVVILGTHWNHHNLYGTNGWGRGNIFLPEKHGFDFTYQCDQPFMVNRISQPYYARWKKQDKTIELLEGRIGTDKTQKCELKIELKPNPYERSTEASPPPPATQAQ